MPRQIENLIKEVLKYLEIEETDFSIEHPDRPVIIQPLADLDVDGLRQTILNINWSHIVNDPRLRNSISKS